MQNLSFNYNPTKPGAAAFLSVISKRPAIAILENNILVQAEPGNVRLIASNLDTFAVIDLRRDDTGADSFAFVVSKDILNHMKPGNIQYDSEQQTATVNGFRFPTDQAKQFPAVPDTLAPHCPIDPAQIARLLKYATRDEMRPAMTGVNIGPKLCASDGQRLITAPGIETLDFVCTPASFWGKLKSPGMISRPTEPGKYFAYKGDGVQIITRSISQKYPDFAAVIPESPKYYITADLEKLTAAVNHVLPAANKTTKQIFFDILPGAVKIWTQDIDTGTAAAAVVQNTTTNAPGTAAAFNGSFLLQMLKDTTGPSVLISFDAESKPFRWKGNAGELYLLMPVIIYDQDHMTPGAKVTAASEYREYYETGNAAGLDEYQIKNANEKRGELETLWNSEPVQKLKYDEIRESFTYELTGETIYTFRNPSYQL